MRAAKQTFRTLSRSRSPQTVQTFLSSTVRHNELLSSRVCRRRPCIQHSIESSRVSTSDTFAKMRVNRKCTRVNSAFLATICVALLMPAIANAASCHHLKRVTRDAEPTSAERTFDPDPEEMRLRAEQLAAEQLEEQQLRLEYIKQQILSRLGMTEAPKGRRMDVDACMHLSRLRF